MTTEAPDDITIEKLHEAAFLEYQDLLAGKPVDGGMVGIMRRLAVAVAKGPEPDASWPALGPEHVTRGEDGSIILQFGIEPMRTMVVGAKDGKPPFTMGWL